MLLNIHWISVYFHKWFTRNETSGSKSTSAAVQISLNTIMVSWQPVDRDSQDWGNKKNPTHSWHTPDWGGGLILKDPPTQPPTHSGPLAMVGCSQHKKTMLLLASTHD